MLQFDCPRCGHTLKLKDDAAGKRRKCKHCAEVIRVPERRPAKPSKPRAEVIVDTHRTATPPPTELVRVEPKVAPIAPKKEKGRLRASIERFTGDAQDPKVVERFQERINELLMADETLLYIAVQNKPLVTLAPDCIVLTNKRFVIYRTTVIGRVSIEDYVWRRLRDAKITEGIMGATSTIEVMNAQPVSIDYLPKPQARQVYRIAQEQEEKALEERRQRDLENSRAQAGGVVVQSAITPAAPQATPEPASHEDPVKTLQKLKNMLDADLITPDEYEKKKAEIISRM
jgi:hypothetical protein